MFDSLANDTEAEFDRGESVRNENIGADTTLDWRSVHRALCRLSVDRAKLDAEEARWLREAVALQIWRPLGMVSALDYLERVLGYSPKAGQERLRVARALGSLPVLSAALAEGTVAFSAVRELSRVATPITEAAWLEHAKGMNVRQVEDLVSGHRPGDLPQDPPDPDVRTRVVRFELSPESFALLRQAHGALNEEHGRRLSDDELVTTLCSAALARGSATAETEGRARFQIAVTLCERCRQGWQDGAGARVALSSEAVDRATCDAQHIGSIDDDAPARATQEVPPSVMRLVWRRDGGRCRVPGCRSSLGLEVHHLVHRADGGGHDPSNLAILCSACHLAHHRGLLTISGTADHLEVHRPGAGVAAPHVGASRPIPDRPPAATAKDPHVGARGAKAPLSSETTRTNKLTAAAQRVACKQALIDMGWKAAIADAASLAAVASLGDAAPLDRLIVEALRRCPRPSA